jgi:hypothetical protein
MMLGFIGDIMSGAILPAQQPQTVSLPEDSCFYKALSGLPLIGSIVHLAASNSLSNKAAVTRDREDLIRMIQTDNDYQSAATVRNVLTLSALITVVAMGIISALTAFFILCAIVGLTLLTRVMNANNTSSQLCLLLDLRDGRRPGTHVPATTLADVTST